MGHGDNGGPAFQDAKRLHDGCIALGAQGIVGFVKDHNLRLQGECACNRHALQKTHRQLLGNTLINLCVIAVGKTVDLFLKFDGACGQTCIVNRVARPEHGQVFKDRALKDNGMRGHISDPVGQFLMMGTASLHAINHNLPLARFKHTRNQTYQG